MDPGQCDERIARPAKGPSRGDALKGTVSGALAALGLPIRTSAKDNDGCSALSVADAHAHLPLVSCICPTYHHLPWRLSRSVQRLGGAA